MAMQTTVERVEARVPVTVMALSGELDASNYLRLVDDVRPLYGAGARSLLLDLGDLDVHPSPVSWRSIRSSR